MRIPLVQSLRGLVLVLIPLLAAPLRADGEPVVLPVGMSVPLVLQHHVNSAYTPAGSRVFFRVEHDVVVNDQVLIAEGTLVTGKMAEAAERGMVGKAGSMLVSVDNVTGVDGTRIAVDADLSRRGRSRGAATVGWTLFWGLPGLITKGVNPYMERGDALDAVVSSATPIDPAAAIPKLAAVELGPEFEVTNHRWAGEKVNGEKQIDIERHKDLKSVEFKIALPSATVDSTKTLESLRLYEVDGVVVPEEIRPITVKNGAAQFDGWSIGRYCANGVTNLLFVGTDADGQAFHAGRSLKVKIKKKQKN